MPRTGMDGDTGGLIHYYQVFILVDEVQGAGGRDNAAAPLQVIQPDGEKLAHLRAGISLNPLSIQKNAVRPPLNPADHRARQSQPLF